MLGGCKLLFNSLSQFPSSACPGFLAWVRVREMENYNNPEGGWPWESHLCVSAALIKVRLLPPTETGGRPIYLQVLAGTVRSCGRTDVLRQALGSSRGCGLEPSETMSAFVQVYWPRLRPSQERALGRLARVWSRRQSLSKPGAKGGMHMGSRGASRSLQIWFLRLDVFRVGL